MEETKGTPLHRREFLGQSAVLLSAAAVGCAEWENPTSPETGGTPNNTPIPSKDGVWVNMAWSLESIGGLQQIVDETVLNALGVSTPILLTRVSEKQVTAVLPICTHAGCQVFYASSTMTFHCPCHWAEFALDGSVLAGPPRIPLTRFSVTIEEKRLHLRRM